MDMCGRCGDQLQALTLDDSMEVAGHTFTAQIPARRCVRCGDILIESSDVHEFEQAVVLTLARSGQRSGAVVKALRKGLSLSVTRVAELLGVPADAVTGWEEDGLAVPPEHAAMLRSFVLTHHGNAAESLDGLALLRQPQQLAQKIRLHLQRSWEGLARRGANLAMA